MFEKSLKENLRTVLCDLFNAKINLEEIEFEIPTDPSHGDLCTNIAFRIAGKVKKSPVEVAEKIAERISEDSFEVKSLNGFVNFRFTDKFLFNLSKDTLAFERERLGKRVVVDYSAPNIAKPFGIGHLRSTIIGQAIYNLYQFEGWETVGVNHLGDWGTQYGKLIFQIKRKNKNIKDLSIGDLENLYVEFHKEAKDDPGLEEGARIWFKKLEDGDGEAVSIWESCVKKSIKQFEETYSLLDVEIDYCMGESFYQDKMKMVLEEAKGKEIAKESKGALIVDFGNEMPPAMLLKSDGSTTYFTRDLATVRYRIDRWNPDLFIYEIGADQKLHMRQLFKTVEMLGWKKSEEFFHVAHGMYRLKEGKMSTRKGRTIHLEYVLNEAMRRAEEIMMQSETVKDMTEKQKKEAIKKIAVGAVKYADLKNHYSRDIVFDWEKVMNLRGDSGPYLQYSLLRARSVLNKCKQEPISEESTIKLNSEERAVLKKLIEFDGVIESAVRNFTPSSLAGFAFELAKDFNAFYSSHPILKAPSEIKNQRIFITEATHKVLNKSLDLLGIPIPERM